MNTINDEKRMARRLFNQEGIELLEFGLENDVANILMRSGITSVEVLLSTKVEELLAIPGITEDVVDEILDDIDCYNFYNDDEYDDEDNYVILESSRSYNGCYR